MTESNAHSALMWSVSSFDWGNQFNKVYNFGVWLIQVKSSIHQCLKNCMCQVQVKIGQLPWHKYRESCQTVVRGGEGGGPFHRHWEWEMPSCHGRKINKSSKVGGGGGVLSLSLCLNHLSQSLDTSICTKMLYAIQYCPINNNQKVVNTLCCILGY